jgi:hypothetical protein
VPLDDFVKKAYECTKSKCDCKKNWMWEQVADLKGCYAEDLIPVQRGSIVIHTEEVPEQVETKPIIPGDVSGHHFRGEEYMDW